MPPCNHMRRVRWQKVPPRNAEAAGNEYANDSYIIQGMATSVPGSDATDPLLFSQLCRRPALCPAMGEEKATPVFGR